MPILTFLTIFFGIFPKSGPLPLATNNSGTFQTNYSLFTLKTFILSQKDVSMSFCLRVISLIPRDPYIVPTVWYFMVTNIFLIFVSVLYT